MREKLTVVGGYLEAQERNRIADMIDLMLLWCQYYQNTLFDAKNLRNGQIPQDLLKRMCFAGTKYLITIDNIISRYNRKRHHIDYGKELDFLIDSVIKTQAESSVLDGLLTIFGEMTPRSILNAFPVSKEFDGEKWCSKDYFYTMDVVKELDMDKPIGKEGFVNLLWDYQNDLLFDIFRLLMRAASKLHHERTGMGIAEEFCDKYDIPTYTINEQDKTIMNNQTGKISKMKRAAKHLSVV